MNRTRFPRTLNEAFPFGPEYGCAIEVFKRRDGHWWAPVVCVLAAIVFLGCLL